MKKILITAMIFFIIILTGCRGQLPTEPVTKTKISKESSRKMEICCEVQDPYSGVCQLNGTLIYSLRVLPANSITDGNQTVFLTLDINAVLCDRLGMMHLCWQIKDYCEEELSVSEDGIRILEKDYAVSNRNDVLIRITYLITLNGVSISSISIVPSDNF